MSRLLIAVPTGRQFCGRALLVASDGTTRAGPFRALGTASVRIARDHGNPDASTLLPFGHPPTGSYLIALSLPPRYVHKKRARRYGRAGGLLLSPRSGDALRATDHGRKLVALHGGPLDRRRRLRPTRGGIRLSNKDMLALLSAINDAQLDGDGLASVELVEIDMQLTRKRDRKGNHGLARRRRDPRGPTVSPMLLLPFALGGGGKKPVSRRDVLLAATAAFGAVGLAACDRPSDGAAPPYIWQCFLDDSGITNAQIDDAGNYRTPDGAVLEPELFDASCPPGWTGPPLRVVPSGGYVGGGRHHHGGGVG